MPLYEGGSLDQHYGELRDDVDRALTIVGRVAETLAWLHEGEPPYVHRDVHVGNIFLQERDQPVLGDFGLVHIEERDPVLESLPTDHFGLNAWRPPELEPGSGDTHNPKADVFLLGGVLYQVLSGGRAIPEPQHLDGRYTHEQPGWALTEVSSDPRVPHVQRLLCRMLARDPKLRFTAHQVAMACESIRRWSPGDTEPIAESPLDALREALGIHLARSVDERKKVLRDEVYAVCAAAAAGVEGPSGPVGPYTEVSVEPNRGDLEADRRVHEAFPGSVWAAVRVKVDFEPGWERRLWLSYVLLIGNLDMEERVVLLTHERDWSELSSGVAGDPRHQDLLRTTAAREANRLVAKLARELR